MRHLRTADLSIIGACSSLGQKKQGVDLFPDFIRRSGLLAALRNRGWKVEDLGDLQAPSLESINNCVKSLNRSIGDHGKSVFELCTQRLAGPSRVLCLGGDHSIAMASVTAAKSVYPDLKVIWIDAHGDINTPATSLSGNFHGMPLAALLGLFNLQDSPGFEWFKPLLRPSDLYFVGPRDLDEPEQQTIETLSIAMSNSQQMNQQGGRAIGQRICREMNLSPNTPVHLSIDIDALDPSEAPATGVTVGRGITLRDTQELISHIEKKTSLVSVDLVEINPLAANPQGLNQTLSACFEILLSMSPPKTSRLHSPIWSSKFKTSPKRLAIGP